MVSVFAVSATLSLLSHISYSSRMESVRRFAFGVLLFSVVASPVLGGLLTFEGDLESLLPHMGGVEKEEGEQIFKDSFTEGIASALCQEFSINKEEIRVLAEGFSAADFSAERIRVVLSGGAVSKDYKEIEKYVNEMNIGECRVEIEFG